MIKHHFALLLQMFFLGLKKEFLNPAAKMLCTTYY